jgi:hypothetical protein
MALALALAGCATTASPGTGGPPTAGPTRHVVSVRGTGGAARAVGTIERTTTDGEWLEVRPRLLLTGVRFVRIDTTRSPSWVAWREVSILGQPGD